MAEKDTLTQSLQESVLTALCFGGERGQIIAGMVTEKHFEPPYSEIAKRAIFYRQKYGEAPGKEHIDDVFDHVLSDPDSKRGPLFQRILMALYKQSEGLNEEYVLTRITEFVRRQTYKSVIYRAGMRVAQGGDDVADDVESILGEALRFRADNTDPGTVLNDPVRALAFLDTERNDTFSIGIKELDARGIAPTRKELLVFLAARKRGKSWFVTHICKQGLLQRLKVLDVSLEMSEERKVQRIFQSLFSIAKREEVFQQVLLDLDLLGRLESIRVEKQHTSMTLNNPDVHKFVSERQNEWGVELGNLRVKQFPTGALTIRKLIAYLDFLEQVSGYVPDILCVDYPKLMSLDPKDTRLALGRTFEELRGIAVERNFAVVAPHQGTRAAETASKVGSHMASEDISIIATADNIITYSATEEERSLGLARLFTAGARNDFGEETTLITQSYRTGQFVLQSAPMRSDYFPMLEGLTGTGAAVEQEEG